MVHIHQLARLQQSAATHGDLLISVAEYRTTFLEQAQRTSTRLLPKLSGIVVIWLIELGLCMWFFYVDAQGRWEEWAIISVHAFIMLTMTVTSIAIANDRIGSIPEAAVLATPLMSSIVPQVSSAKLIFDTQARKFKVLGLPINKAGLGYISGSVALTIIYRITLHCGYHDGCDASI
mmetsp:Transcript_78623/g.225208  ORF Transcript_78623/g.225208 Transcript_78623/m.225208 type:complete len:177 (-) Transcript_78623:438-968(-)